MRKDEKHRPSASPCSKTHRVMPVTSCGYCTGCVELRTHVNVGGGVRESRERGGSGGREPRTGDTTNSSVCIETGRRASGGQAFECHTKKTKKHSVGVPPLRGRPNPCRPARRFTPPASRPGPGSPQAWTWTSTLRCRPTSGEAPTAAQQAARHRPHPRRPPTPATPPLPAGPPPSLAACCRAGRRQGPGGRRRGPCHAAVDPPQRAVRRDEHGNVAAKGAPGGRHGQGGGRAGGRVGRRADAGAAGCAFGQRAVQCAPAPAFPHVRDESYGTRAISDDGAGRGRRVGLGACRTWMQCTA